MKSPARKGSERRFRFIPQLFSRILAVVTRPPRLLTIPHDEFHARYVGRTEDGRQFFLCFPFHSPGSERLVHDYIALYLFDRAGQPVEALIDDLGPRESPNEHVAKYLMHRHLRRLGAVIPCPIYVAPFQVEYRGVSFGLVPEPPDEFFVRWEVVVQPGRLMFFYPPWDGRYDT